MEHVEYCIELMDIDHVALGSDTLYGDHTRLYKVGLRGGSVASAIIQGLIK